MSAPNPSQNSITGDPNAHDISEFSDSITGRCLCGSISVTINDNLFTKPRGHLCHCENCRKVGGSYVAANLAIEKEKVKIEDRRATMKSYEDYATGSGNCVVRSFCGTCGSPITSEPAIFPKMYVLKMGMFPRIPTPEAESFALHRHPWQGVHEGMTQFATARGGKKLGE